jgi:hypothetical protein
MFGLEQSLGSRIVTYANDLVILCRKGNAKEALSRLREEKTRICKVPEGEFDFLGISENRQGISWVPAIAEERPAHGRERPRADCPIEGMARDHNARSRGEPRAAVDGRTTFR